MHTPLSLDAPTAPRRVWCAGLPFLIIDGRRVWSSEPPAAMKSDLIAHEYNSPTPDRSPDFDHCQLPSGKRS